MSNKKYRKKSSRSRRKPQAPRGRVVSTGNGEVQLALPIPELLAAAHGAIEAMASEAGLLIMKALIDEEVEQIAGKRYAHDGDREAVRWGHEEGFVVFSGRKVPVKRPRVRDIGGSEVPLQRYGMFQSDERMTGSVSKKVLRGVSMRNYAGVIDDVCDGYGVQKSVVRHAEWDWHLNGSWHAGLPLKHDMVVHSRVWAPDAGTWVGRDRSVIGAPGARRPREGLVHGLMAHSRSKREHHSWTHLSARP